MPRNSSGIYNLPQSSFVPGTAIVATPVNSDLSDIATALTQSMPLNGSAPMTGPVKAADGSVSEASYLFASSPGVGFYLNAAESGMAIVIASTSVVLFTSASATNNYGTYWGYQQVFNGSVDFNGGVIFTNGVSTTVTVSGDLVVTKGMIVGFASVPVSNQINIGDANFYWSNDTLTPTLNFDANDFFKYDRANNKYIFSINNVSIFTVATTSVAYSQYLRLPEITAPVSAAANNVRLYAKDNSGTTRVYYKDSAGTEVPMGGPGSWEEITSFVVTASVASIVFSLTKVYSRIVVCGVSMSATADSSRQLIVEVSDDGGSNYKSAIVGSFGGNSGTITGVQSSVSSPMWSVALTAAAADLAFWMEFYACNITTCPKPFSGQAATFTNGSAFFANGQTASGDEIDAVRVRWSANNIDAGTITLYGELAI